MAAAELPELLLAEASEWRRWLAANPQSPGVWLVLGKKGGSVTELVYQDALQEALCFGWIDGQVKRRDEGSYRQRYTPRRPRSAWSARNVGLIATLTEQGRMTEAGLAAVAAAQADGRWQAAYAGPATAVVPADFAEAIAASSRAQAMFDVLTSANRYALSYRLGQVKRAETRARKIAEFVGMLERGETFHPQRAKPSD
ncbi:MAG: YdeI/OmpD-associated family protein [Jatrophihabitantaceae bacterium]